VPTLGAKARRKKDGDGDKEGISSGSDDDKEGAVQKGGQHDIAGVASVAAAAVVTRLHRVRPEVRSEVRGGAKAGVAHEFSGAEHWISAFDSRFDDALRKLDKQL
jgi:hypothetical protein